MSVMPVENSRQCVIEFDGKNYVSKTCDVNDILKKVRTGCKCACGGKILLWLKMMIIRL